MAMDATKGGTTTTNTVAKTKKVKVRKVEKQSPKSAKAKIDADGSITIIKKKQANGAKSTDLADSSNSLGALSKPKKVKKVKESTDAAPLATSSSSVGVAAVDKPKKLKKVKGNADDGRLADSSNSLGASNRLKFAKKKKQTSEDEPKPKAKPKATNLGDSSGSLEVKHLVKSPKKASKDDHESSGSLIAQQVAKPKKLSESLAGLSGAKKKKSKGNESIVSMPVNTKNTLTKRGLQRENSLKSLPVSRSPSKTLVLDLPGHGSFASRYVTISDPSEYRSHRKKLELPVLEANDADWLFKPEQSKHRDGALGIASIIRKDTRLEKAASRLGLLNDEGNRSFSQGAQGLDQSVRSLLKNNDSLNASFSVLGEENVSEESKEFAKQFLVEKKQEDSKSPKGRLTLLINLDPLTERGKIDDEAVRTILKENPELCKETFSLRAFGDDIFPLSILCALNCSLTTIKRCYKGNPAAVKRKDDFMGTPLHYACAFQAPIDVVEYLIHKCKEALEEVNRLQQTPLHLACMFRGTLAVISALVDENSLAVHMSDGEGRTPLHLACGHGAGIEVIDELTQSHPLGCQVTNQHGETPLHVAVSRKDAKLAIVKMLTKRHVGALKVKDGKGRLPLHAAIAYKADASILKYLVKKFPDSRETKNKVGEIPSAFAKRMQYEPDVVQWLHPYEDEVP